MIKRIALSFVVLCMALPVTEAFASEIDYTLTDLPDSDVITFSIPSNPTPTGTCGFPGFTCFTVEPVALTVDGTPVPNGIVDFFISTAPNDGGLVVADPSQTFINQAGPVLGPDDYEILYSGTLADPTLLSFTNLQLGGGYGTGSPEFLESFVLNGTAAPSNGATPEPGSIVLLGSGLLGLAGALRRKLGR
jgi:hypothetical protein